MTYRYLLHHIRKVKIVFMENILQYKTAIYCRLSKDDEQAGESVSIETQKMMLVDYCIENNYDIYDIYVDDGFSGLNFNRPAFTRLLNDIDDGKVNLVITKDLSRLGRDYIQTGYFTEIYFPQKRIRYIAISDGIDTLRNDNDIAPFKNILNDMYAKDLSRKVKLARKQRALKGYYMSGQPPFGYKPDPNNRNHLIVDEEAATIVREIFKLAAEGNSYAEISRKLTQKGVITPSAYKFKNGDTQYIRYLNGTNFCAPWCYETVRTILLDSVYKGDMVNHKTEVINYKTKEIVNIPREQYVIVPNQHEAIIEPVEFEKIQQILNARRHSKKHNYENVFNGIVLCSECGSAMNLIAISRKNGIKRPMFKCFKNGKNECKHHHAVFYEDLYDEILKRIQIIFKEMRNSVIYESLELKLAENLKADMAIKEKTKLLEELSSVKKSISDIKKSYNKGTLSNSNNTAVLDKLIIKQRQLVQRLVMVECGEIDYEVDRKKIEETLNDFFNIQYLNEKLVSLLIDKIEVGETITTEEGPKRNIFVTYTFDKI